MTRNKNLQLIQNPYTCVQGCSGCPHALSGFMPVVHNIQYRVDMFHRHVGIRVQRNALRAAYDVPRGCPAGT
jgi:hypothetical protein